MSNNRPCFSSDLMCGSVYKDFGCILCFFVQCDAFIFSNLLANRFCTIVPSKFKLATGCSFIHCFEVDSTRVLTYPKFTPEIPRTCTAKCEGSYNYAYFRKEHSTTNVLTNDACCSKQHKMLP